MSEANTFDTSRPRFGAWLTEPMLRNKATYYKVAAGSFLINIFATSTALFTLVIYDRVIPNNAMSSLVAISIGFAIVVIFDFILKMLRSYFLDYAGVSIDQEVGESVFRHLLALRLDQKKASTGALAGMMRELEALRDFFASATILAIVDIPFIFLTLLIIGFIGGWLVLVPALLVPLVLLIGWLSHPIMDRLASKAMSEGLVKQSVLVETIGALETVKVSGSGHILAKRWQDTVVLQSNTALRQRLIGSVGISLATSAGMISYTGVVIAGAVMFQYQAITLGGLLACAILAGRAIAPLAQISQLLSRLTSTRMAYRQINHMMETPKEGPTTEPLIPSQIHGDIEFRNVKFSYPGAVEPTLDQISFRINRGERVALLGRVGSGKSTIARLALGLYEPSEGVVMIDGTDLRQYDPQSVRKNFGTVLQENVLLTGTIKENIVLGRDVDDDELIRISMIAGVHQFVGQIANGYELRLADRGEGLSGGQRQSIAIARALAGRPPVFVMDEPSSAMDAQTEQAMLERLQQELAGRSLLLITHRPPLLQLVTRIIVVERGRVAMDGPRDEILKQLQGSPKQ